MLKEGKLIKVQRTRKMLRVRGPIIRSGKLRLSIFRSLRHIYAQIIDDQNRKTIVGIGSCHKKFRNMNNRQEIAKAIGREIGKMARVKGICQVVFDRGRYKYHGRVAALADGARECGLVF